MEQSLGIFIREGFYNPELGFCNNDEYLKTRTAFSLYSHGVYIIFAGAGFILLPGV